MRIALIVPGGVHPSGTYDVIPALLSLIERLARRHQLEVLVLGQSPTPIRFELYRAQVEDVGRGLGARARAAAILKRPYDVLHAFWADRPGVLAGIAGYLARRPVVLSIGGGELARLDPIGFGGQRSAKGRRRARIALCLADCVTAGSRFAIELIPTARREAAQWIPLGADRHWFAPASSLRPDPPAAGEPWRLLQVGSINAVKDPWTLLDAMRIVMSARSDVVLDWAGVDTLFGVAQRRAAELGLSSRIAFHGFLTHQMLAPIVRRAHLFIQASRYESQGVALCEAAMAGVPVIGTAVGLLAELAPHAAVAVPPGDPPTLARAILALLDDPERRAALARVGQRFALEHDADWTAARFEALYASLTHARP
jgi:glycosyltransferase involved in cell wall biosynthesis